MKLLDDKDLNLVVGLWNYNGSAIASALEGLGKKGTVLAAVFDEDDGTLDGIEHGTIQITVVQKPFMFGYLASKSCHRSAMCLITYAQSWRSGFLCLTDAKDWRINN